MAKLTFVVLVLTAFTVQADNEGGQQKRTPRFAIDPLLPPPPPPPPPPFFHTHQWSGFERSSDGKRAGVFSGAAAAAQGGSQASGQAFSVASAASGDNGPVLGTGSQVDVERGDQSDKQESQRGGGSGYYREGYHSGQFGGSQGQATRSFQDGHESRGLRDSHYSYQKGGQDNFVKGERSGGFGVGSQSHFQTQAQSSAGSGYSGDHRSLKDSERITSAGYQQQQLGSQGSGFGGSDNQDGNERFTSGASSKASSGSNAFQNSGHGLGQGYESNQRYDTSQGNNEAQNQKAGAFSNVGASAGSKAIGNGYVNERFTSGASSKASSDSNAFQNSGHGLGHGYESDQRYDTSQGNNEAQNQKAGAFSNVGASAGSKAIGNGYVPTKVTNSGQKDYTSGNQGFNSGNEGYSGHQGYDQGQTALNGALNLASQGLQVSQPSPGCSTCGKSNYALSNAKSHSGDAVAVSVGG